jgi:hypothetical protein
LARRGGEVGAGRADEEAVGVRIYSGLRLPLVPKVARPVKSPVSL